MMTRHDSYNLPALAPRPPQPGEEQWGFLQDLKRPLHAPPIWQERAPGLEEADLRGGVCIESRFPDPGGLLVTAYADFREFLAVCGIPLRKTFPMRIVCKPTSLRESFRIAVTPTGCTLEAGDCDGVRRALVYLEDEILRSGGPFLPLGSVEREPVIRTRITRCFFGPIKRPPKNRDELLDAVDYYPEPYLNRLAHEGINGLWISIAFADLCPLSETPELRQKADQRIAKLRETVQRCKRYGIRIFPFCIEPAAIPNDSPLLQEFPDMIGHRDSATVRICVSSEAGRRYLEDTVRTVFAAVPDLGGLINISVGERPTLCCNAVNNNCPRCSSRKPWEVLADSLSAMRRGMAAVNPEAELISWAYIPNNGTGGRGWGEAGYREAAAHIPPGVALQHNFESNGGKMQLGHWRRAGDYWLSYIGPAPRFRDCTRRALAAGTRMFAKLQVGCSHEVASVPYVPVPGNLYRKYRKMHELGVSGAMQCWYFGNYPGIMNKAAGELSFSPFPRSETAFLRSLAQRDWGVHSAAVVRAWRAFSRAYANYPLANLFGYYGPMHDGPVWPLFLVPRDLPLAPTWKLDEYWPSGDRIGECLAGTHTLPEAVTLCRRLSDGWHEGMTILRDLRPHIPADTDQARAIDLAEALGIQFESGANILQFYSLRDDLTWNAPPAPKGQDLLARMQRLAERELELDARLLQLCRRDPRLGFHSEAEGYKYFPARIAWRMQQVRQLLDAEFPQVEERLRANREPFPEFSGHVPRGPVYECAPTAKDAAVARLTGASGEPAGTWSAWTDPGMFYIRVTCAQETASVAVEVRLEPRRLWPPLKLIAHPDGKTECRCLNELGRSEWRVDIKADKTGRTVDYRIPLSLIEREADSPRPIRLNVIVGPAAWIPLNPLTSRLIHGTDNPADYGWLRLVPEPFKRP